MPIAGAILLTWCLWRGGSHLAAHSQLAVHPFTFFIVVQAVLFANALMASVFISEWWALRWKKTILVLLCLVGLIESLFTFPHPILFEIGQLGRIVCALSLGAAIGLKVREARYFWPLIFVATVTDLGSVLLSDGFSHELAENVMSDPSLVHPLLVYVVTPFGTPMPLIGLADIAFMAIGVTAVSNLGLSLKRSLLGLALGMCLGLTLLSLFERPLPLLPFLGLGLGASLGQSVKPKLSELFQSLVLLLALALIWFGLKAF